MKKKVLLVTLLVVAIVASCFAFTACNKDKGKGDEGVKVAMITDYGDITDQSFNQTTYEACKAYCDANNIKFKYFKPTGNNTDARVASVNCFRKHCYCRRLYHYRYARLCIRWYDC